MNYYALLKFDLWNFNQNEAKTCQLLREVVSLGVKCHRKIICFRSVTSTFNGIRELNRPITIATNLSRLVLSPCHFKLFMILKIFHSSLWFVSSIFVAIYHTSSVSSSSSFEIHLNLEIFNVVISMILLSGQFNELLPYLCIVQPASKLASVMNR